MRLLRIGFWTGAIVDLVAAVQLLLPTSFKLFVFQGLRPAGSAAQGAIVAAVLLLGFSGLLLWADRRPLERRAVLGVTLGVVGLLALGNVWLGASGSMAWAELAPTLAIQALLAALFLAGLAATRA